jgi:hypothetical protein
MDFSAILQFSGLSAFCHVFCAQNKNFKCKIVQISIRPTDRVEAKCMHTIPTNQHLVECLLRRDSIVKKKIKLKSLNSNEELCNTCIKEVYQKSLMIS